MKEESEGTEREAPQLPERARAWVAVAGGVGWMAASDFTRDALENISEQEVLKKSLEEVTNLPH